MIETSDAVSDLLESLTVEEKVGLVHGAIDPEGTATGYVPGVERLGVPELRLADGPLGVRAGDEPATSFPAGLALSSTFDPDLARRQGETMGREAKALDQDVVLGPGLNIVRVPNCGRNFEYFSEDPVLNGACAAGVVEGLQSEDVVATPKHYVANNQETRRGSVSVEASERALRELYLPGFRAAVEAGAGAVMSSYNRVGGTHMSEHPWLLQEVLKGEFGFDGFVMSDWFGTEEAVDVATGGLDLEMPGISMAEMMEMGLPSDEEGHEGDAGAGGETDEEFEMDEEIEEGMPDAASGTLFRDELADAVASGAVPEERLDDMVARILGQMERVGLLDGTRGDGAIDAEVDGDIATRIAARGAVLLKNEGVLPLSEDADVALIGPNVGEALLGGGGSSELEPLEEVSPVEGVTDRAAGAVTVEAGHPRVEDPDFFGALSGESVEYDEDEEADIDAAVAAAREADVAVVVVRDRATEAADRDSLELPGQQDALVAAVAQAAPTVAVLNTSGPVELPWRDAVDAVLEQWYPGQAHGDALAAVLYGDSDPAGRLPVTFASEDEYPASDPRQFPGDDEVHYDEGVFVGYRHFDREGIDPTYPFGHGHSYAEFAYGDAEAVDASTVSVTVENTADRDGREVVQAYVRPPAVEGVERPDREFAGAESVAIPAGESRTVEIDLDDLAFQRWDDGWTVDAGEYVVEVGRSSRDARAEVTVER
ncbi:MAG: beta-glucosidase [Haloarculaceae archaeon]